MTPATILVVEDAPVIAGDNRKTVTGGMNRAAAACESRGRFAIPIVDLASHSDDGTLTRAAETRPDGYVVKPFDDRDLGIAIEMALKKHAQGPHDLGSDALDEVYTGENPSAPQPRSHHKIWCEPDLSAVRKREKP